MSKLASYTRTVIRKQYYRDCWLKLIEQYSKSSRCFLDPGWNLFTGNCLKWLDVCNVQTRIFSHAPISKIKTSSPINVSRLAGRPFKEKVTDVFISWLLVLFRLAIVCLNLPWPLGWNGRPSQRVCSSFTQVQKLRGLQWGSAAWFSPNEPLELRSPSYWDFPEATVSSSQHWDCIVMRKGLKHVTFLSSRGITGCRKISERKMKEWVSVIIAFQQKVGHFETKWLKLKTINYEELN